MENTQRRIFPFDACSVLLFSALSMASVTASHAQMTQGTRAQPSYSAAAPAAPSKFTIGPAAQSKAASQAAFDKDDANHDGKLSRDEAAAHKLSGQQFQQADKNQDGFLSREEFQQGSTQ